MVLRSMHTCGFNTLFRPHRREITFRKRMWSTSMIWLHPCFMYVCMYVSICVCVCVDVSVCKVVCM